MAIAGRRRSIIEDMTEVRVAACAQNFDANHTVTSILMRLHILSRHRLEETWPTRSLLKFVGGREERKSAAYAAVNTLAMVIEQRSAKGCLGALAAGNLELLACQLCPPLRVRFDHWGRVDRTDELALLIE